jgi:hypothetical protein
VQVAVFAALVHTESEVCAGVWLGRSAYAALPLLLFAFVTTSLEVSRGGSLDQACTARELVLLTLAAGLLAVDQGCNSVRHDELGRLDRVVVGTRSAEHTCMVVYTVCHHGLAKPGCINLYWHSAHLALRNRHHLSRVWVQDLDLERRGEDPVVVVESFRCGGQQPVWPSLLQSTRTRIVDVTGLEVQLRWGGCGEHWCDWVIEDEAEARLLGFIPTTVHGVVRDDILGAQVPVDSAHRLVARVPVGVDELDDGFDL